MNQWYEKNGQLDSSEQAQMHAAYFNTFYASKEGRQVLCDLFRRANSRFDGTITPEIAIAQLILTEFVNDIKKKAGVIDQMTIIEKESEIAKNFTLPESEDRADILTP